MVDWIERGDVDLVINTPGGTGARSDGYEIRRAAVAKGIPCATTLSGGIAAARAIAAARHGAPEGRALQELHRAGLAREYEIHGSSSPVSSSRELPHPGEGAGADPPQAGEREGGRADPGRDRGPSRSRR